MYEILKKLLLTAEEIGTVKTVCQSIEDPKFYARDEIRICGITINGRPFTLTLELSKGGDDHG